MYITETGWKKKNSRQEWHTHSHSTSNQFPPSGVPQVSLRVTDWALLWKVCTSHWMNPVSFISGGSEAPLSRKNKTATQHTDSTASPNLIYTPILSHLPWFRHAWSVCYPTSFLSLKAPFNVLALLVRMLCILTARKSTQLLAVCILIWMSAVTSNSSSILHPWTQRQKRHCLHCTYFLQLFNWKEVPLHKSAARGCSCSFHWALNEFIFFLSNRPTTFLFLSLSISRCSP